MPKLKDLVQTGINEDNILIQGVKIPVTFTMQSFPFIEQAYGKPYAVFEHDLNNMMRKNDGKSRLGHNEARLMNALIYSMVRSGGTETNPKELASAIPVKDLQGIFQVVLDIFNNQNFQKEDMDRLKTEKK